MNKNLLKEKKNPCTRNVGKWLGLTPAPNMFSHALDNVIVQITRLLINASGIAACLWMQWR